MTLIGDLVVVAGGGGFIGGAVVADLRARGCGRIRAVDTKPVEESYRRFEDVENVVADLNLKENCNRVAEGAYDATI